MARPLRIEYAGALYHVTSRGNGGDDIYFDNHNRETWLEILGQVCERFNWNIHAYCLMSNHYHILVETPDGNLSKGMRQLNGVYTQSINRTYNRQGHIFQGRYKAILVQKDVYLMELSRYIVLNPVRAGLIRSAREWRWSNYRFTAGMSAAPKWLDTDGTLGLFARRRHTAQHEYRRFVAAGKNKSSPWSDLRSQIYLGSDDFVKKMQQKIAQGQNLSEIPKVQRTPIAKPMEWYFKKHKVRDTAIFEAFSSGAYSMREIGDHVGLHYSRVSRIICQVREKRRKT